ncbi:esterase-like activity of phytase family protein [Polymorphospora rubra]|uniref:esterase-like activity of phytase family protein n=1 Tax=Polymorphospora rubra TaxID=338584 RepID=UPI0033E9BF3F
MPHPSSAARRTRVAAAAGALGLVALPALVAPSPAAQAVPPLGALRATDAPAFQRLATVPAHLNSSADDEAVAEISAVSADGNTVISTDAAGRRVGFLNISDPANPTPGGVFDLPGEPTSVGVHKGFVLVAVNTSESFTDPSGVLVVLDLASREVVREIDLGGQPDSVAVAPSGGYAAIAIENERDEDLDDGEIPQLPAGWLTVVDLSDDVDAWELSRVELTGLAEVAPGDPEPEYVSINGRDEAVVTLQENNHLVVVDLAGKKVVRDVSAGSVELSGVDTVEDGSIVFDDSVTVPREPDGVTWIGDTAFATANEGDYQGGSRGFTIWNADGRVVYDAGNSFDRLAAAHGLYPEGRSDAKGSEPEGIAFGRFDGRPYLFVASERGNFVAVYDVTDPAAPAFVQVLPTTNGPEGVTTVASRGLLVVSSEEDLVDEGIRASVQIYRFGRAGAFPSIRSAYEPGQQAAPITWGALSGLSAVPGQPDKLVAVNDNVYTPTRLLTIDVARTPALIEKELTVTKGGTPVGYDAEGVAARAGGGYWLAVEGAPASDDEPATPNLLVHVDDAGAVQDEVPLPAEVAAAIGGNGLEGVAVTGAEGAEQVWVAVQRELKGDPAGTVRIGRYSVADGGWAWLSYKLDAAPSGGWVGLSELVAVDDDTFAVVERDNRRGPAATVKKVYAFDVPDGFGAGDDMPAVTKRLAVDLLPLLRADNGWVQDKVEGMAIAGNGQLYAVTDNDGLDDATGETVFLRLGKATDVLGGGGGGGGGLPVTGAPALALAGAGVLIAAGGIFAVVRARRNRIRFTA